MKNAHERFGVLEYAKRMKDTTTRIRLRLDRFIGEAESEGTCKAHLLPVVGGDSDVGAIWAAVVEQSHFTVEAPGINPLNASLGEDAQCFRGTINIAGQHTHSPPGRDLSRASQDTPGNGSRRKAHHLV